MGRKENAVQSQIMEYLRMQNIMAWRQNSGMVYRGMRSDGMPRIQAFTKFDMRGKGDISGILPDGKRLEIECKSEKGRQSIEQKRFEELIKHNNGVYILAKTVEEVIMALRRLGYVD